MIEVIVGQNIRSIRQIRHMTLEDLSFLSGLDSSHLGKIERGQHNATLATIDKIAAAFSMTLSELIATALPDEDMIDNFVKNTFPYITKLDCYDPLRLLDYLGQIMLDRLTLRDVEESAYGDSLHINYRMIKQHMEDYDNGRFITYGIEANFGDAFPVLVQDICCNVMAIKKLVNYCNNLRVSREHFIDVVEDFIQSYPDEYKILS